MTEPEPDENKPTLELPRALVEFILLGPEDDRRQLQDSPILGDVWLEFGRKPGKRLELLITPYKDQAAATLAAVLTGDLKIENGAIKEGPAEGLPDRANIAFLQGIVAASLRFDELLGAVVPMTSWWRDKGGASMLRQLRRPAKDTSTTASKRSGRPRCSGFRRMRASGTTAPRSCMRRKRGFATRPWPASSCGRAINCPNRSTVRPVSVSGESCRG